MPFEVQHQKPQAVIQTHDYATGTEGILVIDNTVLGPGKGGIRMVPDITVEEVTGLAKAMTLKNALADLPFGGAKAGVVLKPGVDKSKAIAAFARTIRKFVPDEYVSGPDMNTTEVEMAAFANALGNMKACTGKPTSMGGLPHELGSTGFGVAHATLEALRFAGLTPQGARVAIEGFGNVGTFAAKYLHEHGAIVVAVSDLSGCYYKPSGLPIPEMLAFRTSHPLLEGFGNGLQRLPKENLFGLPADVLIPGARPHAIHDSNKESVKAKLIVEAANIPVEPRIERELEEQGVALVPDVVANAGGVISSYVEFIGGTEKQMFERVKKTVTENTRHVLEENRRHGKGSRAAAIARANERIEKAYRKKQA